MAQLIVEPAERTLCRTRVIILDEVRVGSNFREAILVVRLQKKPARIAKNLWLKFPDVRERCVYSLQSKPFLANKMRPNARNILHVRPSWFVRSQTESGPLSLGTLGPG